MTKNCNNVVFYYRMPKNGNAGLHNNKPKYTSWPKLEHHDSGPAVSWAESYYGNTYDCGFITMPNLFTECEVINSIDSRGQSAKVPQAVVYCKEKDCYFEFDFRVDGLIESVMADGIANGEFNAPMSFRFAGSNYYFVPTAGSFQKFKETFTINNAPKTATSTAIEIGVPFVGSHEQVYTYMGSFACTEDATYNPYGDVQERTDYSDNTVHVYYRNRFTKYLSTKYNFNETWFSVSKSKMNVKRLYDVNEGEITTFDTSKASIEADSGSKGSYGIGDRFTLKLNFEKKTLQFVEKEKVNDGQGMCFWR